MVYQCCEETSTDRQQVLRINVAGRMEGMKTGGER